MFKDHPFHVEALHTLDQAVPLEDLCPDVGAVLFTWLLPDLDLLLLLQLLQPERLHR